MKKLIASIFFVISAIAMLNSCSDPSSNSSVNISGDLTWNGGNGNDVDLISIPIGFQNGGTDNATPISIKVSGSILDNGACQDKLIYSDGQGFQLIPGASFTGYRSTQSTPIGLVFGILGADPVSECAGLSGTLKISFSVNGQTYAGSISRQF